MSTKRNPKLHELIAVRANLKQQAAKTMADLSNTFEKKQHHFTAKVKAFTPNGENAEAKIEEQLDLQTTVKKELIWVKDFIVKSLDVSLQVATGNTTAKSDIVLENGTVLATDIPATTLLELEDSVEELRKFAERIPTLDAAKGFRPDPDKGEGVFVSREVEKTRTQAQKKIYTLAPATDKHPAQTQLVDEQVAIGTIREREWSSMLTVAEKGDMLYRIEELSRAVRKARARANETEVDISRKIGGDLIKYAFGV